MTTDPDEALERLRAIALKLPGAIEKPSHGTSAFFIDKGRTFAWFSNDHHGDGRLAVLVKTSGAEEQAMLLESDPELYFRPPYVGHKGWIGIRVDVAGSDWDHVDDRVATSWEMVAPRRLLEAGGR